MILIISWLVIYLNCEVHSGETYRYEKLHNFGLGKRVIPSYRHINKYGHPEELPTKKPVLYIKPPYHNVYQGAKRKGDRRVYNKKFNHEAAPSASRVVSQAMLDCVITHIAVETEANVPIIYRGGAGYRFFVVIVKSDPGVEISGRVRAYCKNITLGIAQVIGLE